MNENRAAGKKWDKQEQTRKKGIAKQAQERKQY
jgi:hypothetical protein